MLKAVLFAALFVVVLMLVTGCEDRSGLFRPPASSQGPYKEDPLLTKISDCLKAPEKLIGLTITAVMEKCGRENAYTARTLATTDGTVVLFTFDYLRGSGGICCPIVHSPKLYVSVRNDIVIRAAN